MAYASFHFNLYQHLTHPRTVLIPRTSQFINLQKWIENSIDHLDHIVYVNHYNCPIENDHFLLLSAIL
jgi:hypothetical protein